MSQAPLPDEPSFGVYVHIPFCTRRCDYCAFATWTDRFHLVERYAAACREEVGRARPAPADTVFFGGGTPSLLPAPQLEALLHAVGPRPGAEVTVECNPEDARLELFRAYAGAGVSRLSFGVQSMVPAVLASLGRAHDVASVRGAVACAAEAGFAGRYSVDLIFGAAGESPADWQRTLQEVLALDPPPAHVSAYGLTVEAGTPLARAPARHPNPDDQADKYLAADRALEEAGLRWYEISNWAVPGQECRHNQLYWRQGAYLGVGCAAHSHEVRDDGSARRYWNVRTPDRYVSLIEAGRSPVGGEEVLAGSARQTEQLELALRTRSGVPSESLPDDPAIESLVRRQDGSAVLTPAGRLLYNEVALRLRATGLAVTAGTARP